MATPNYDKLQQKVLEWSNRDAAIFGNQNADPTAWKGFIGDFLDYAADEAYRLLRIPSLEYERTYTVEQDDVIGTPNISVLGTNNWAGTGGLSYVKIPLPVDYTEMKSIRLGPIGGPATIGYNTFVANPGIVFNERTDERTFFDIYAETYSNFYWMRKDNYLYIKPALAVGTEVILSYYRQLPALNADYAVQAINYLFGTDDANGLPTVSNIQPFLYPKTNINATVGNSATYTETMPNRITATTSPTNINPGDVLYITSVSDPSTTAPKGYVGPVVVESISGNNIYTDTVFSADSYPADGSIVNTQPLYFVNAQGTLNGITYSAQRVGAYDTMLDAQTGADNFLANYPTLTFTVTGPQYFEGAEVYNWLKDKNERILIWGALMHVGGFLDDDKMEARYEKKFMADIASLNNEEVKRRAKGGNVNVHYNGNGLI